jgi:hypothetical protein
VMIPSSVRNWPSDETRWISCMSSVRLYSLIEGRTAMSGLGVESSRTTATGVQTTTRERFKVPF